ncbi:MAG: hypothetical protein IPF54_05680 [Draconibacterium sp.]|nr:hypothetical protein [Draconibacterium sp.]
MISSKKEKIYICTSCGFQFSNLDVDRTCSNCFACTGCEIYNCPSCDAEVVIKPIKQMKRSESQ